MPQFDIKQEPSKEVAKATFDKKEDYIVIVLKDDPIKKNHLVHKIHGQKLIDKKLATKVDAKLDEREVVSTTIKEPKFS